MRHLGDPLSRRIARPLGWYLPRGGFLPTDLSGLILWLKADAGTYQDNGFTTPASSDGDVVGGWQDQSGNGNDVTQAAAANKPLLKLAIQNGLPMLRFDGSNDYLQGALSGALSQPFNVFAVAMLDASVVSDNSYRFMVDGDDITNRMVLRKTPTTPRKWTIGAGVFLDDGSTNSNYNIWSVLFNGASSQIWINGSSQVTGNAGAHNADGVTVGAQYDGSNPWLGDIGEIIIYDPSLSTANRQLVEAYLSSRWGI